MSPRLQVARQASPIGSSFDTEGDDTAQSGRPGIEAAIAILVCRDADGAQSSALGVYRYGDVVGFVRVDADEDLVHVCPLPERPRASIEEDRTVKVRDRQAPMKSRLVCSRGNLMVDTSTQ